MSATLKTICTRIGIKYPFHSNQWCMWIHKIHMIASVMKPVRFSCVCHPSLWFNYKTHKYNFSPYLTQISQLLNDRALFFYEFNTSMMCYNFFMREFYCNLLELYIPQLTFLPERSRVIPNYSNMFGTVNYLVLCYDCFCCAFGKEIGSLRRWGSFVLVTDTPQIAHIFM